MQPQKLIRCEREGVAVGLGLCGECKAISLEAEGQPMQVRVRCEACGGTGRNDVNRDEYGVCSSCPECNGRGSVPAAEPQRAEQQATAELGIAWSEAMQRLYALLAAAGVR